MRPGEHLQHYRLVETIGSGTFGTVWLAHDELLDDQVAIKVLADNWARDDDFRRRFIDEAKIMRRLDHQRVVRVFSVGEVPTGQPMFIMSFADGGTLEDRLRAAAAESRRLDIGTVVTLMADLLDALGVVHDFGYVHRDVKPSNVLFRRSRRRTGGEDDDGLLVLGDFGLATDVDLRHRSVVGGTPAYMAPEQADSGRPLDHRADLYAAVAVLHEMLTGAPPAGALVADAASVSAERLRTLRPDLPPAWAVIVERGLADDPEDRYASADAVARAIHDAATASAVVLPTATVVAEAPARRSLGPIAERVAEVLERFGAAHSEDVDRRLGRRPVVAVVGDDELEGRVARLAARHGFDALRVGEDDVRLGTADVVVHGAGIDPATMSEILADAPAGPVAVLDERESIGDVLSTIALRVDAIQASAALATLDDDVRSAGSIALSEAWVRVGGLVERLRFDTPELAELDALRQLAAGAVRIPVDRRQEAERVLLEREAWRRLGAPGPGLDADLVDRAVELIGVWRTYQGSGRVPFAARDVVATVLRAIERLWAEVTPGTS